MKFSLRLMLSVCLLAVGAITAGEYATREELQKIVDQLDKLQKENAEIKAENGELKNQVTKIKATAADLDTSLDDFITKEEFKPVKDNVAALKSGSTKFLLTGSASTTFTSVKHQNSTFSPEFDPIYLWKLSERLSFEAETPITPGGIELEYADLAYVVNDYLTMQVGKFKSPFGLFNMRFDPAWINKLGDPPMAYDDGAECLVPHEQVGIMGSGAFDIVCDSKLRYAAFVSNGIQLDATSPSNFGVLVKSNDADNNNSKGVGGRVGILPIACMEFGISAEYSNNVFNTASTQSGAGRLLGADLSMNRDFKELLGTIDFKAEYVNSRIGRATYSVATPMVSTVILNRNNRSGTYAQFAYRPTLVKQKWVKNMEGVFRYDHLSNPRMPAGAPSDAAFQFRSHDRWTVGFNYYLEPSTILKCDYENDSHGARTVILQCAVGF